MVFSETDRATLACASSVQKNDEDKQNTDLYNYLHGLINTRSDQRRRAGSGPDVVTRRLESPGPQVL